jgi:RNase P subunit RPR2
MACEQTLSCLLRFKQVLSMSKKFSIYEGRFFCHSCKNEVLTARYWKQEVELSWKCKECEEVSVVSLSGRGY